VTRQCSASSLSLCDEPNSRKFHSNEQLEQQQQRNSRKWFYGNILCQAMNRVSYELIIISTEQLWP
jgi:hypothetical protein